MILFGQVSEAEAASVECPSRGAEHVLRLRDRIAVLLRGENALDLAVVAATQASVPAMMRAAADDGPAAQPSPWGHRERHQRVGY